MLEHKTPGGNIAYVEYTNKLPLFRDAQTVKNRVKILPIRKGDVGLLTHELTHVDQYYKHRMYSFRYKYFAKFRMRMETEAYAAQYEVVGLDSQGLDRYAWLLAKKYNLGITQRQAKEMLVARLNVNGDEHETA